MKIGLDIDDTINYSPRFFTFLTKNKDFEIYIVTGRSENSEKITFDLLKQLNIKFKKLYMFPISKYEFDNQFELSEAICDWKVEKVKELNIDVFFDNNEEVLDMMKEEGILCFRRL